MDEALAELLPLAVVIAVSPIPVLAVILMLLTERSTVNSAALLAGWALALAVIAGCVAALGLGSSESGEDPGTGLIVAQFALAALLLAGAVRRWRMHSRGRGSRASRWLDRLGSVGPAGALALGFGLIALNPKDGLLTVAAGARLAEGDPGAGAAAGALAVFVATSSGTIAAPIAAELALGDRAEPILKRSRAWLERNGNAAVAAVLLVLGVLVAGDAASNL
jgi:Sap, sulfolipid-1-addressing protein